MKVIVARDPDQASSFAAHFVVRRIQRKPDLVLGLATGRTLVEFYRFLAQRHRAGEVSFGRVTTFNMDEYVGLAVDHPASYHAYMRRHLFEHVDLSPGAAHLPEGEPGAVLQAAEAYEQAIRAAGGIDLQMAGIGRNGHLAFNEPGSSLSSHTRVKRLAPETILANASEFGGPDRVPRYVLTVGLGTVMEARMVLLLAFGGAKAEAVRGLVEGPVTASCPASVLQMHPHAFVVVDREAAAGLSRGQDTVDEVLADPFEEFFWEGA